MIPTVCVCVPMYCETSTTVDILYLLLSPLSILSCVLVECVAAVGFSLPFSLSTGEDCSIPRNTDHWRKVDVTSSLSKFIWS